MNRRSPYKDATPLLYLVATPIGNLSEFPPRAIEVLGEMDVVACEDTRVSGFLLDRFSIKGKTFFKMEKHNEAKDVDRLLELAKEGKKITYLSDAGYPLLSDPGSILVRRFIEEGYNVSFINGPSAFLPALLGSGLYLGPFHFEGFLPSKKGDRVNRLKELKDNPDTLIFYEAPHRLMKTVEDLYEVLGDRKVCLARELTKLHEEYLDSTLKELSSSDYEPRGEYVVVVEGAPKKKEIDDEAIEEALRENLKTLKGKDAVKKTSEDLGVNKNRVYECYLRIKG